MIVDDLFNVVHAAIADRDGIAIEYFSKFVVFGKVFFYLDEEPVPSDTGVDVFAEWRVVPENVVSLENKMQTQTMLSYIFFSVNVNESEFNKSTWLSSL